MSSIFVRETFTDFLLANAPGEQLLDLTAQYSELKELMIDAGFAEGSDWLGIEFIADDEVPVTVPATNSQGKYRETGAVYLHVVSQASMGVGHRLLARGEAIRNILRGQRISGIIVESVTPMVFGPGATLQFEGGWMSGSFLVSYQYDQDLF